MIHTPRTNRRSFLKGISAITAASMFPNLLRAQGVLKKVALAGIGVTGKGESDIDMAAKGNDYVALCDPDKNNLAKAAKKFPNAKLYSDFRKMLDEVKEIEAVTISTPDHMHYCAAMHAIAGGRHVFIQKPLTNTLWENRELYLGARKKGVITQMGNQGHTYEGNRVTTEWVKGGAIGKVKEVHVWTNRPIWPQGKKAILAPGQCPETLDWTQWLGATPDIPYSPNIHPFKWRGFLEWGAGAFGDMGCHLMDAPFVALGLTTASAVTALKVDDLTDIAWPEGAITKLEFANVPGHGDIPFTWYEGKKPDGTPYLPEFPPLVDFAEAFKQKNGGAPKASPGGWMIIGTEGLILNKSDQAQGMQIWSKKRSDEFLANPPAQTEKRSIKPGDPQQEWIEAIRAGHEFKEMSQFDYSIPLTEATLIGGLSMRFPGVRLEWDSKQLKFTNHEAANQFIKRKSYRKGWEYSSAKI